MNRRRVQLLLVHAVFSQSRHVFLADTFRADLRRCMNGPSVRDLQMGEMDLVAIHVKAYVTRSD
jgi:hypothetical protein